MDKCQENIRFLIPRPITPVVKPPMYRSIFTESVKRAIESNKNCHRTMGYAEVHLNPPSQFLKAHSRRVIRPFVEKVKCDKRLPRVPKQSAPNPPRPQKNILKSNIVEATRRIPPLPKHRVQDTRNGHTILLPEAGLEPHYVCKKDYGKMPEFLLRRIKKEEKARRMEEERIRAIKPPLKLVSQEERERLLNGLRLNRLELNTEYLTLPMLTDSLSKIKRKVTMEKELDILDSDIALLERKKDIYVCRDEE